MLRVLVGLAGPPPPPIDENDIDILFYGWRKKEKIGPFSQWMAAGGERYFGAETKESNVLGAASVLGWLEWAGKLFVANDGSSC